MTQSKDHSRKQAWWGALLAGLGIYFLIRELDLFAIPSLGDMWPIFVVGFGAARLLTARKPGDTEGGLFLVLIGLWLFACELHWWDFTYRSTWPVAVVIVGLTMVLRSVLERSGHPRIGGGI